MSKYNTYAVYWIHLPEHSNMYTQGYIGITKNVQARFTRHKSNSASKLQRCKHLENAINKYGELVVYEVIKDNCSEELACSMEKTLRPTSGIGWNIAAGGNVTKLFGKDNHQFNKPHLEVTKEKISKSRVGKTAGLQNPKADHTKYTFTHEEYGVEVCTKYEFKQKYGHDLKPLFRTKNRSTICKGWSLK